MKWQKLDKAFKKEVKQAKADFYKQKIAGLKLEQPGKWYSALKRISSFDQIKTEQPVVDEINHLPDQEQAELIADQFASIQNEYQALEKDDVSIPPFSAADVPQFHPSQVWFALSCIDRIKINSAGRCSSPHY